MAAQNTLRTSEEKQLRKDEIFIFEAADNVLKRVELPDELQTCKPHSELPFDIRTMLGALLCKFCLFFIFLFGPLEKM